MTPAERAKTTPPPECRPCQSFDSWKSGDGSERCQCIRGLPMHPQCVSFRLSSKGKPDAVR